MTQTATPIHLPATVARKLSGLRRAVFFWLTLRGTGLTVVITATLMAVSIGLDWYFRMDRPSRTIVLFLGAAILAVVVLRVLMWPLSRKISDDALVLRVEARHRHLGQALISALQFSRIEDPENLGISPAMMAAAIDQGTAAAEEVDFGQAIDGRFRRRSVRLAAGAGLCAAIFIGLFTAPASAEFMRIWAARNLRLSATVQWPRKTLLMLKDQRSVVARGDDWEQSVEVTGLVPRLLYIDVEPDKADASEDELAQTSDRTYRATLKNVLDAFRFRIRGGDDQTDWIHVAVVDRPRVEKLEVFYTPPAYTFPAGFTGSHALALPPADGSFEVLTGSSLHFVAHASKPLGKVELLFNGKPMAGAKVALLANEQDSGVAGDLDAGDLTTGTYALNITDTQGYANRQPTRFAVRLIADRKPVVRVELQGVSGLITPRATVRLDCRADDDFGVAAMALSFQASNEEAQSQPAHELSLDSLAKGLGERKASCAYPFEILPLALHPGAQLVFHVEARDRDDVSGPNVGQSPNFFLKIVTDEVLRNELLRREQEQRQEFERLIKDQEKVVEDCLTIQERIAGKPLLGEDESGRQLKADLVKYEKRIRLAAERCIAVSRQFRAILAEVLNNKLEDENGPAARKINGQILEPLAGLVDRGMPAAAGTLGAGRNAGNDLAVRDKALAQSIEQQKINVDEMKKIVRVMEKWESYQQAINDLRNLIDDQGRINQETLQRKKAEEDAIFGSGKQVPMRKTFCPCLFAIVLAIVSPVALPIATGAASVAPAATTAPAQSETALSRQQARAREMMDSLEQTFLRLSEVIRANEPEKADKLIKAMQAAKEKLIQTRMAAVIKLLGEDRLDDANKEQKKIVDDLQALLVILTQDDTDKLRRDEELRLEAFRAKIDRLIKEETGHISESDKAADPGKALADLAAKIKALDDLIKAQEAARDRNVQDRAAGPQALGKAADMQHDVSKATIDLARKLSPPPSTDNAGGDEVGNIPATQPNTSAAPPATQPGSSSGQQAPPKPGDGPGEQAVARAIGDQHKAEDALSAGKGPTAETHQNEAIKDLKEAKGAMEKERDRIARLPPDNANQLAKAQNQTTGRTGDLAKEMAKPSSGAAGAPNGGAGTQPANPDDANAPPPTPGKENVEEAARQMGGSEGDLKNQKPGEANGKQREARKQLENAKDAIEKRLAQLRKEMQEQRLADLENRFRAILDRQRPVTRETLRLDRSPLPNWGRPEIISCDTQSDEERALGELTQQALTIIAEDGTTVVFPKVVEGLRDDFGSAQALLKDHSTNQYTQEIQKQIEQTLQELIDALKKAQQQAQAAAEGQQPEDAAEDTPQPLVPDSAELKLLRAAQLRVNTRTTVFEQVRPPAGGVLDPVKAKEIQRLAELQRSVQNMTEEMAQKKQQ